VAETEERSAKRISRRVVLTLGALTAGAVVYGQLPESPPDPSISPSTPEQPTQTPNPTSVLKNRDPSVIAPLKRTRNTSGALRR